MSGDRSSLATRSSTTDAPASSSQDADLVCWSEPEPAAGVPAFLSPAGPKASTAPRPRGGAPRPSTTSSESSSSSPEPNASYADADAGADGSDLMSHAPVLRPAEGVGGAGRDRDEEDEDEAEPAEPKAAHAAGEAGPTLAELEFPALVPVPVPRLGVGRPPTVERPPASAFKRDAAIRASSGLPVVQHHDQISFAVQRLERVALQGQKDILLHVEQVADDASLKMEQLADRVPGAVSAAIAQLESSAALAKVQVVLSAMQQIVLVALHNDQATEEVRGHGDTIGTEVYGKLMEGSAKIQELDKLLGAKIDAPIAFAAGVIKRTPDFGGLYGASLLKLDKTTHTAIPGAPLPGVTMTSERDNPGHLQEVEWKMVGQLNGELDEFGGQKDAEQKYYDAEKALAVPGLLRPRQAALTAAAEARSEQVATLHPTIAFQLLHLVTPVAKEAAKAARERQKSTQGELDRQAELLMTAKQRMLKQLTSSMMLALGAIDEQLEEQKKNLREAGAKMMAALRGQAKVVKYSIGGFGAPMAEVYPDLVRRLTPLLPPDTFLDARVVLPQVLGLVDSARAIAIGQADTVDKQWAEIYKDAEHACEEQLDGLHKAGREGGQQLLDVPIAVALDLEMQAARYTGHLSAGADATIARAHGYAERTAEQMLHAPKKLEKILFDSVLPNVVRMLNRSMKDEVRGYLHTVRSTENDLRRGVSGASPLQAIQQEVASDLDKRRQSLIKAMPPKHETASTVAHVASFVPGVMAVGWIASGWLAYEDRTHPDDVVKAIGDLSLLGLRALEEIYTHDPGNILQDEIRERMEGNQRDAVLQLFSADAAQRALGRNFIALDSTVPLIGFSREAREAALRGLSAEERAALPPVIFEMTRTFLGKHLEGDELRISSAYLDRDAAGVVAARLHEQTEKFRHSTDDSGAVQAISAEKIIELARLESGLQFRLAVDPVAQERLDELTRDSLRAHAVLTGQATSRDALTDLQAATLFADHVTADRAVLGVDLMGMSRFGVPEVEISTGSYDPDTVGMLVTGASALMSLTTIGTLPMTEAHETQHQMDAGAAHVIRSSVMTLGGPRVGAGATPAERAKNDKERATLARTAWAARTGYDFKRAEGNWFGLSDNEQVQLRAQIADPAFQRAEQERLEAQTAYENASTATPADLERRAELGRRLVSARAHYEDASREHALKMEALGGELDPSGAGRRDAGGTTEYLARRTGQLFSQRQPGLTDILEAAVLPLPLTILGVADRRADDAAIGEKLGRQMIEHGRADESTELAFAMNAGNKDFALEAARGRTEAEANEARRLWALAHPGGDTLDQALGIEARPWTDRDGVILALGGPLASMLTRGGMLSGDKAHEMQRLMRGDARTDRQRVELAALEWSQQRLHGTGWISSWTMDGGPHERRLDDKRRELGEQVLHAAGMDGALADPAEVFDQDGRIRPAYANAFDVDGNLRGSIFEFERMRQTVREVHFAAESFKNEIDRQEKFLTDLISALAIVATIVVLCIPGVNLVAAGVIIAVAAGAATIAVKAGMRGERYGKDELAMDIAMTVIEAATAAIGGKLGSGVGKTVEELATMGTLARFGASLEQRFGRVMGAAAREAIVGGASNAARVAIQEDTWKDGLGTGLGRVLKGGVRGAAVSAVTAGVSAGIEGALTPKLAPVLGDVSKLPPKSIGALASPAMREIIRETLSNTAGALAGEIIGLGIDVVTGDFHGTLADALEHLGTTALRELLSNAGRASASAYARALRQPDGEGARGRRADVARPAHAAPGGDLGGRHALRRGPRGRAPRGHGRARPSAGVARGPAAARARPAQRPHRAAAGARARRAARRARVGRGGAHLRPAQPGRRSGAAEPRAREPRGLGAGRGACGAGAGVPGGAPAHGGGPRAPARGRAEDGGDDGRDRPRRRGHDRAPLRAGAPRRSDARRAHLPDHAAGGRGHRPRGRTGRRTDRRDRPEARGGPAGGGHRGLRRQPRRQPHPARPGAARRPDHRHRGEVQAERARHGAAAEGGRRLRAREHAAVDPGGQRRRDPHALPAAARSRGAAGLLPDAPRGRAAVPEHAVGRAEHPCLPDGQGARRVGDRVRALRAVAAAPGRRDGGCVLRARDHRRRPRRRAAALRAPRDRAGLPPRAGERAHVHARRGRALLGHGPRAHDRRHAGAGGALPQGAARVARALGRERPRVGGRGRRPLQRPALPRRGRRRRGARARLAARQDHRPRRRRRRAPHPALRRGRRRAGSGDGRASARDRPRRDPGQRRRSALLHPRAARVRALPPARLGRGPARGRERPAQAVERHPLGDARGLPPARGPRRALPRRRRGHERPAAAHGRARPERGGHRKRRGVADGRSDRRHLRSRAWRSLPRRRGVRERCPSQRCQCAHRPGSAEPDRAAGPRSEARPQSRGAGGGRRCHGRGWQESPEPAPDRHRARGPQARAAGRDRASTLDRPAAGGLVRSTSRSWGADERHQDLRLRPGAAGRRAARAGPRDQRAEDLVRGGAGRADRA
jgi:hypothetical protein